MYTHTDVKFTFTYDLLKQHYEDALALGYEVWTCLDYYMHKPSIGDRKVLVNRVDIDLSVKKTKRLIDIFNQLHIKGTFFLRLHAPEYNPFSFENYKIIRYLLVSGHELGYHSEIIDQAAIWNEDAADCLKRDIFVMNAMFNIKIKGIASHGGMTGLNNLDFWKDKKSSDFGLLYEAYDKQAEFNLFQESLYVSDSEWTQWKCYNKGLLMKDDRRNFAEHAKDGHKLLHVLIHPDTYFDSHFYETDR